VKVFIRGEEAVWGFQSNNRQIKRRERGGLKVGLRFFGLSKRILTNHSNAVWQVGGDFQVAVPRQRSGVLLYGALQAKVTDS
jgi:hypothetical protein